MGEGDGARGVVIITLGRWTGLPRGGFRKECTYVQTSIITVLLVRCFGPVYMVLVMISLVGRMQFVCVGRYVESPNVHLWLSDVDQSVFSGRTSCAHAPELSLILSLCFTNYVHSGTAPTSRSLHCYWPVSPGCVLLASGLRLSMPSYRPHSCLYVTHPHFL